MDAQELMTILESLTPGGSEFHNSPKNCAEWVRGRLATFGKVAAERNDLRKQLQVERELTEQFATQAGLLKMQLVDAKRHNEALRRQIAERDAAVLLNDTAVATELEAHGVDRAGVGS